VRDTGLRCARRDAADAPSAGSPGPIAAQLALAAGAPTAQTAPSSAAPPLPADLPRPVVTLPDVRLAYLFEWVDDDGTRHFGGWVAIAVSASRWILSDGSTEALEGPRGAAAARAEKRR
jgi:hypothetical protein